MAESFDVRVIKEINAEYSTARKAAIGEREWFKWFMGAPSKHQPGALWRIFCLFVVVLALGAIVWLVSGCRAMCIESCRPALTECLSSTKTSEERVACTRMYQSCANACAGAELEF